MIGTAGSDLNIVVKLVDQASDGLKNMSSRFDEFGKKIDEQTKGAQKFTKAIAATAGVVGGLAIREFANFEKQMSTVKAITGANEEQFAALTSIAKEMGATTAFTGVQAGEALEFLGMAGLTAEESLAALPGTLELAAAASMDLGTAADIATNIMAQFGIKAENIGRVNDVLAKSATTANTSVGELSEAMVYMGPVASALGVSLEETASVINVLANNGIKGGKAGQSLSASLLRITSLTSTAADSVKTLGLELFDTEGKFVGITETVGQLNRAFNITTEEHNELKKALSEGAITLADYEDRLSNTTDQAKAMHISNIFGITASKQWLTLVEQGTGSLEDYTESLENAAGAAKEMAEIKLDNLAGDWVILRSAVSGLLITLGGAIGTYVRPAIQALTDLLTNFQEKWQALSPVMQNVIKYAGLVAVGLGAILLVVGTIGIFLPLIAAGFGAVAGALGFLLSPIGLVAAAIGILFLAWQKDFLGIQGITENVLGNIAEIFTALFDFLLPFIQDTFQILTNFWTNHGDHVIQLLTGVFNIIIGVFQGAFDIIYGIAQVFTGLLTGDWEMLWEGIKNVTLGAVTILTSVFTGFFNVLQGALGVFIGLATAVWEGFFLALRIATQAGWNAITAIIQLAWEGLSGIFTLGGELLLGAWTATMEGISGVAQSIWQTIKNVFATGINWIIDKVNGLIDRFNSIAKTVPGVPTIQKLQRLEFQNGGIVPGNKGGLAFQNGGIVPGGKLPAHHDQIPAMLDPGELILNRAQQKNISAQLTAEKSSQRVLHISISGNSFYGDDASFIDKIGDAIIEKITQNLSLQSF